MESPPYEKPAEPEVHNTGPKRRLRKWLFRGIAILIPLLPILVAEVVFRFQGYGGYPPVLRRLGEVDGLTYYGSNQPGLSTFFFQNLTVPGAMEEQVFTIPKPADTVRIFILGESAARGFPQPRTLAASSFLEAMLAELWSDQKVEVINLGTTALASFPLMYILDEVLELSPDLIIIYAGNNEFYGAHGVASVHSFGQSTLAMKTYRLARRLALVQWITDVATRQEPGADGDGVQDKKVLMEQVIADSQIGPDDPRRQSAAANLENHISYLVDRCVARGVPIIVSTLPANERDLAPIGDDLPPDNNADAAQFAELLDQSRKLLETDPVASLATLQSAAEINDAQAELHFLMGRCLHRLERFSEAAGEFTRAKDLDTMPWRAPSACNDSIRRAAARRGDGDSGLVHLSDLEAEFRAASPGGSIGWELMDDHVHPSLAGQALIARTWLMSMTRLSSKLHVEADDIAALDDGQTFARQLGDNLYDRYGVAHRMVTLFESGFYRKHNAEALHRFEALRDEYAGQMSPAALEAARQWQDPHVHKGGHRPITGMVGLALMREGNYAEADQMLTIARRAVPKYSLWNLEFSWNALACRRQLRDDATPEDFALARETVENGLTFMRVTGMAPPAIHHYLGLTYNLVGMHEQAIRHLNEAVRYVVSVDQFPVVQALADSLVRTGHGNDAIRLLSMPLKDAALRQACDDLREQLQSSAR